jgi:hypothetical protein
MLAEQVKLETVKSAIEAIDAVGSNNSGMMAARAIHINLLIRQVPGAQARFVKTVYNDIGAEVAISSDAYYEKQGCVTDMLVMGTIYQHREVKRILEGNPEIKPIINAIASVVEKTV